MEKKNYIVGVDIGSSNVVVAVGCRRADGKVSVEGIALQSVENGVTSGGIDNVQSVGMAIRRAKTELEEELGIHIDSAYAGISGNFIRCASYTDHVYINDPNGCISKGDLASLRERMNNVKADDGEQIIDRIPQCYFVDDGKETATPIGSFGRKLSATYLFVLCRKENIQRTEMAFYNAGLKMIDICVNPAVLPSALLSDEEREEGVAVIDLGGGTTDIAIVRDNTLRYIASIPIGASTINDDMHAAGIAERNTESVKKKYGAAVSDMVSPDVTFPVQMPGLAKKEFLQVNLAAIIEARLKDIIEFAWNEIRSAKFARKIPCGIVLTGGSALLDNIDELFRRETGVNVRLATASDFRGIDEESQLKIQTFANSAAVAILLAGASRGVCGVSEPVAKPEPAPTHAASPVQQPKPNVAPAPQPTAAAPQPAPVAAEPAPQPIATAPVAEPAPQTDDADTDEEDTEAEEHVGFFGKVSRWIENLLGNGNNDYL